MKILDEKFRKNLTGDIFQCALATITVFIVLMVLDVMTNPVIIAALGSSTFIAFTMPEAHVSKPRIMIGGYIVGVVAGCICHYLSLWSLMTWVSFIHESPHVVFGAMAVGLAIFVMVITGTAHPPAAGLALGLILNEWSTLTIVLVFVGIISLSVIKSVLKPVLKNLL